MIQTRRSVVSGWRDEKWIGRSRSRGEPALTRRNSHIIAFAEIFNGHSPGAARFKDILKRLHHHQNNDENHQHRRNLVQNAIKSADRSLASAAKARTQRAK